jgi:hypothetical protein
MVWEEALCNFQSLSTSPVSRAQIKIQKFLVSDAGGRLIAMFKQHTIAGPIIIYGLHESPGTPTSQLAGHPLFFCSASYVIELLI